MAWAIKCTLDDLSRKKNVFYTGGTNDDSIAKRATTHKRAYVAFDVKMFFARTSRVKYQENKLRDLFRPFAHKSNCDDGDGFVYALCSKQAKKPNKDKKKDKLVKKKKATKVVKKKVKKVVRKK